MDVSPAFAIHDELASVMARLRWRFGLERLLLFAVRGATASAIALVIVSTAAWLTGSSPIYGWLATSPFVAAVVFACARWPSHLETARAADRRLGLDERLSTAVELSRGVRQGRFDQLQISDAAHYAQGVNLAFDPRVRNETIVAACVLVLAAASLLLPLVPRPMISAPTAEPATTVGVAATDDALAQRALPLDAVQPVPTVQVVQAQTRDPSLASRVQQEQAEQSSLNALAQALGSISAGQAAADAIQQGDFGAAANQIRALADQADQLSGAAKQQLSQALQRAATASAQADRQLADKERLAADALAHSTYSNQQQALRNLADQLQRSGGQSVPTDQLERDQGQLQQQSAGASPSNSSGANGSGPNSPQGGAGIGTSSSPDVLGATPQQLATSGQRVDVPTKLSAGPGLRPPDPTADQMAPDPSLGGKSVSEMAQTQQTGQVAPEQNLVPGEQRSVIRGYFT